MDLIEVFEVRGGQEHDLGRAPMPASWKIRELTRSWPELRAPLREFLRLVGGHAQLQDRRRRAAPIPGPRLARAEVRAKFRLLAAEVAQRHFPRTSGQENIASAAVAAMLELAAWMHRQGFLLLIPS